MTRQEISFYDKPQTDTLLSAKANTADLAPVATSGSYDDLTDKPTIPAAQVQSDWSQSDNTAVDYIKNKPDLSQKLDKIEVTAGTFAYATTVGNPNTRFQMTGGAFVNTIPIRQANGVIDTGEPTQSSHATTKNYVDNQDNKRYEEVYNETEYITYSVGYGGHNINYNFEVGYDHLVFVLPQNETNPDVGVSVLCRNTTSATALSSMTFYAYAMRYTAAYTKTIILRKPNTTANVRIAMVSSASSSMLDDLNRKINSIVGTITVTDNTDYITITY